MYWYRIDLDHIEKMYSVLGASTLSPSELAQALTQEHYLLLTNLIYRDNKGHFKSWHEWEPLFKPEMWINPKRVIAFHEFVLEPELT